MNAKYLEIQKDFEVARFDAFGTWWLILMRKQTEF